MRVHAGNNWIDLRDISQLTWDDQEIFESMAMDAYTRARDRATDPATGELRQVISDDGVTMTPVVVRAQITPAMLRERRDAVLAALITDWSYTDLPLPFTAEAKKQIDREMAAALISAVGPYMDALGSDAGPKEETAASSGSDSSSKARPRTSRPA